MKKQLSHFAYNERSRSGWTLSIPRFKSLSPIRSTIKKLLPMSPARLLPLSPVRTPPCQRGTLTSDTASLERERLVTYRKRLFHSPPAAGYQNDRQACHSFLRERQSVFDAASCL